jgi:HPt (histidine-containing phosphotransfer) domain-containing protein
MKSETPRTDEMVKSIKGWQQSARAQNLAWLCRRLERELNCSNARREMLRNKITKLESDYSCRRDA